MKLGLFGLAAAALAVGAGPASAQTLAPPPGPAVAAPYGPGFAVGATANAPGQSLGGVYTTNGPFPPTGPYTFAPPPYAFNYNWPYSWYYGGYYVHQPHPIFHHHSRSRW